MIGPSFQTHSNSSNRVAATFSRSCLERSAHTHQYHSGRRQTVVMLRWSLSPQTTWVLWVGKQRTRLGATRRQRERGRPKLPRSFWSHDRHPLHDIHRHTSHWSRRTEVLGLEDDALRSGNPLQLIFFFFILLILISQLCALRQYSPDDTIHVRELVDLHQLRRTL